MLLIASGHVDCAGGFPAGGRQFKLAAATRTGGCGADDVLQILFAAANAVTVWLAVEARPPATCGAALM